MKKVPKKPKSVVKGAPSGLVISLLVHAAAFMLAGLLVVFNVVKKEEKKFVPPPPVERPKMKLKKPKPRVKKSSKPKSVSRIVTQVKKADMPDIQLPELSGMGDGLAGGLGEGFDLMPDLDDVSIFGSSHSIGNDFEGTFYDLKRDRSGRLLPPMDTDGIKTVIRNYIESGWKQSKLARFYRSPKKLYTPTIFMGAVPSILGPWAFNEPESAGYNWLVHYKGQIVHKEGGRFRFCGMGDNWLVVRLGDRVVLDFGNQWDGAWEGEGSRLTTYHMAHWPVYEGPWFDLAPGVPLEMEVILGEYSGGLTAAMLAIEEEGVEYPTNFEQGPKLPIFKTADLTLDQLDAIYEYLCEDHYSVTNGPVFNDYAGSVKRSARSMNLPSKAGLPEEEVEAVPESKVRTWTLKNGQSLEAELITKMGDKLALKMVRGRQVKIPLAEFSEADMDYVELENPPPLKITFQKETDQVQFEPIPNMQQFPNFYELTAGVKIEKTNRTPYTKPLTVELFTFASEIDGDHYILLDRVSDTFTFDKENGKLFELWGQLTHTRKYVDGASETRGERFCGRMIVVTDQRGEIIAQEVSNPWMLENLDFLRTFPVGRHFNDEGKRVHPPRPVPDMIRW